jgi:hypothetical protein
VSLLKNESLWRFRDTLFIPQAVQVAHHSLAGQLRGCDDFVRGYRLAAQLGVYQLAL